MLAEAFAKHLNVHRTYIPVSSGDVMKNNKTRKTMHVRTIHGFLFIYRKYLLQNLPHSPISCNTR